MSETVIRIIIFLTVLLTMFILESRFPAIKFWHNRPPFTKMTRYIGNYGLVVCSVIVTRLSLPLGLTGVAVYGSELQWGLFNIINLPYWVTVFISLISLDIIIYWQHRLSHQIPWLWRLHKVHHADSHIDTSTALRFHPLEILASLLVKIITILIFGIPASAVILFEVLLNGFAIFNHANIRLPKKMEALIRVVLVTQMLHRIHHSQNCNEYNSNFGFSVIWWDKLFGSYRAAARKPDEEISIGLAEYPATSKNARLEWLLRLPFNKNA